MGEPASAEFDNVVKDYAGPLGGHKVRAVDGVSLRIEPGDVLWLLGPNRAGKTTLVKMLVSLARPTRGRVHRFGKPSADRRTLARVGYMHENHAFPRYLSAAGLLEFYGALSLVPAEVLRRRIPALLEQVGLADRAGAALGRFSKGMLQRLGLAQALINEPELLVLDEPMAGLDFEGRKLIRRVIQDQKRQGRAVLLVSHTLEEGEQVATRAAVLVAGRLRFVGLLSQLTSEAPLEQALEELCGGAESKANLVSPA